MGDAVRKRDKEKKGRKAERKREGRKGGRVVEKERRREG